MNKTGRLIVSISNTSLTDAERAMLRHPMIAGVILFTENYTIPTNYKDKIQLRNLIIDITQTADKTVFVDQEGGFVQRLGRGFKALPAAQIFGEIYDLNRDVAKKLAYEYGAVMAAQLMEFGIISLAPVCDLDGGNTVITRLNRAFHKDAHACVDLLYSYIDGMNAHGMNATGKHFPGHGYSSGDTHLVQVTDDRSLAELEATDLSVFIELIKANKLAAIMPAHILYPQIDANHTAGASKIWLQEILRGKYGYQGLIISDCLSMAGAGSGRLLDKAEQALTFGDISILCHQEPETILQLCDDLLEKGFALSPEGQQRYAVWTNTADAARRKLAHEQAVLA